MEGSVLVVDVFSVVVDVVALLLEDDESSIRSSSPIISPAVNPAVVLYSFVHLYEYLHTVEL